MEEVEVRSASYEVPCDEVVLGHEHDRLHFEVWERAPQAVGPLPQLAARDQLVSRAPPGEDFCDVLLDDAPWGHASKLGSLGAGSMRPE